MNDLDLQIEMVENHSIRKTKKKESLWTTIGTNIKVMALLF